VVEWLSTFGGWLLLAELLAHSSFALGFDSTGPEYLPSLSLICDDPLFFALSRSAFLSLFSLSRLSFSRLLFFLRRELSSSLP